MFGTGDHRHDAALCFAVENIRIRQHKGRPSFISMLIRERKGNILITCPARRQINLIVR